jgi:dihydrofolate synthase/folylpolyglutamate synthase
MMTYKESIGYLYKFEKFGIKYNLENIRNILNKMGNPQNDFLSYHIAGTNGKGTVSALINSFLVESGFKVGL